jgi:hypothetical protein
MAVTSESSAPYTAPSALLGVINRYREKGMQAPFTADVLMRAGVADSLIPRTLQSLQILELIGEDGMPTATLEKIRKVAQSEYRDCISSWIKAVYAEIFQYVDPAKDDETRIRDAFRTYNPVGQQSRMVSLFLGLCTEAGLVDGNKKSGLKPRSQTQQPSVRKPIVRRMRFTDSVRDIPKKNLGGASLHPALGGLLESLPLQGWTQEKREKFLRTFESVIDFVIPIIDDDQQSDNSEGKL